jgi:hypothetical protein
MLHMVRDVKSTHTVPAINADFRCGPLIDLEQEESKRLGLNGADLARVREMRRLRATFDTLSDIEKEAASSFVTNGKEGNCKWEVVKCHRGIENSFDFIVFYFHVGRRAHPKDEPERLVRLWNLYVYLVPIDLRGTEMSYVAPGTSFYRGTFSSSADLRGASVHCSLAGVNCRRADFRGTDLRNAEGFILDENAIEGTYFPIEPRDPYSLLRKTYTGPRYAIVFALSLAALLPHLLQGFIPREEPRKVYEVILGWHEDWIQALATCVLITYSCVRLWVTFVMSGLRDAEERTKRTPSRDFYFAEYSAWAKTKSKPAYFVQLTKWLFSPVHCHRWFLHWVYKLAVASIVAKILRWLASDVPQLTHPIKYYRQFQRTDYLVFWLLAAWIAWDLFWYLKRKLKEFRSAARDHKNSIHIDDKGLRWKHPKAKP